MMASLQPERGKLIADRYRVERRVGTGAMGEVWAGQRLSDGREVALKLLLGIAANERESLARFRREAQVLARVRSEYVSEVLDFFTDDELGMILVMELVPGKTLHHILWEEKKLSVEAALDVAADVLRGLNDLHDANIVHRDLKPGNIVLKPRGELRARAVVIDFGVSRIISSSEEEEVTAITRAGRVLGTLEYMAPEQILGSRTVTPTADLYALGAIMFRAIAGDHVYRDLKEGQLALAKLNEDPRPLPLDRNDEVANATAVFVGRLLARRSKERFETTEEALDALAAFREPSVEDDHLAGWTDDDIDLAQTVVRDTPAALLGAAASLAKTWVAGQDGPPADAGEAPAPFSGDILDEPTVERFEPPTALVEPAAASRPPPLPPEISTPAQRSAEQPVAVPPAAHSQPGDLQAGPQAPSPEPDSARNLAAAAMGDQPASPGQADAAATARGQTAKPPQSSELPRRSRWRAMGSVVLFSALGAFGGALFGVSYLQGGRAYEFVNSLRSAVSGAPAGETTEPTATAEPHDEEPAEIEDSPVEDEPSEDEPTEDPAAETTGEPAEDEPEPVAAPPPPPPPRPPRPPATPWRPPAKPPAKPPTGSTATTASPTAAPSSGTTGSPAVPSKPAGGDTAKPPSPPPTEHEPTEL